MKTKLLLFLAFLLTLSPSVFAENAPNNIKLTGFLAPLPGADSYSDSEVVTITVVNECSFSISDAILQLYLNGYTESIERLPEIAANSSMDYTFEKTLNLNDVKAYNSIMAEVIWEPDEVLDDNVIVTGVSIPFVNAPYIQTLYKNDYASLWSKIDNNNDGATFGIENVFGNDRATYIPGADNATTDEIFLSHAINLKGGQFYAIQNTAWTAWPVNGDDDYGVEGADAARNYTVTWGYYTKDENDVFSLVEDFQTDIYTGVRGSTAGMRGYFTPKTDGLYYVGLHLTANEPRSYGFSLDDFQINESAENDLMVESVSIPGTRYTCLTTIPISLFVKNNGKNPVESFKVRIYSNKNAQNPYEEEVTLESPLAPGANVNVKCREFFTFDLEKNDAIVVEAVLEGDGNAENDKMAINVTKEEPLTVPVEINVGTKSGDYGWLCIDGDLNGDTFKDYSYPQYGDPGELQVSLTKDEVPDQAISLSFNLESDKLYKITCGIKAGNNSEQLLSGNNYLVSADGVKTLISPIIAPKGSSTSKNTVMVSYVKVDKSGEYVFVAEDAQYTGNYTGYTPPLYGIVDVLTVEEATGNADIEIISMTGLEGDKVYDNTSNITVEYKNAGDNDIMNAVLALSVNDKAYHSVVSLKAGEEGKATFSAINLIEPGEYTVKAEIVVNGDATPENNVMSQTVKSLAIVDVEVVSLDSPTSGELGHEETVAVTVKNNGKGALTAIPMSYTFKNGDMVAASATQTFNVDLAAGESMQLTFDEKANLAEATTYSVTITANVDGETHPETAILATNVVCTHEDLDAGVTAIVGPNDTRFSAEDKLVISVKNYGTTMLYDVPVCATIINDKGETVANIFASVSEIPAGEAVDFTFPTPVDLSWGGDFQVTAATTIEKDVNTDNDSFTGTIHGNIYDCGVISVSVASYEAGNATVEAGDRTVTVVIENFGDFTLTEIPVRYKIGIMPQAQNWTGELKPGETTEFSFTNTYNFKEDKEYTVLAYTELAEDERPGNDSTSLDMKGVSGINLISASDIFVSVTENGVKISLPSDAKVTITETSGRLVCNKVLFQGTNLISLNSGIYMLTIRTDEGSATLKCLVK